MSKKKLAEIIFHIPALATITMILGFLALWQFQTQLEKNYLNTRIAGEAHRVELEIAETIKQTSQALQRYASRIELLGSGNKEFLNLDSQSYLEQLPILKRIGLINPSNHVYWSYPAELSNQVLGFDQSTNQHRLEALNQAKESRKPTLSQAIELRSGGIGFLLPIALYPKGKFAGFVYATIEANKLFYSFVPTDDFQVSIFENGRQIFQSKTNSSLVSEMKQTHEMIWSKSKWSVDITPTEKFIQEARSSLPTYILFFGILISFVIGGLLQNISRSRNEAMANAEWRKALINSSDYAIISTDADGIIKTFNQAATKMLGYEPQELIGKATPKIFHVQEETLKRAKALTIELGREVKPGFDTFTAKAKSLRIADENEWTFVRKDKSVFPANLSVTALSDSTGEVVGYLGICADLTEKKKTQEQLATTSERLRRVVEATEEGIWEREFTPGGKVRFLDSQAKKIFGFEPDHEPSYEEVTSLFSPEEMAKTAEQVGLNIKNKTPGFEIEIRIRNSKSFDKERWIRARGKITADPDGTPLLVSTVRDVTGEIEKRELLKTALIAAEDATKAKSEFLANMSHEIRTPLNGVLGMTGLLLDSQLGPTERQYAETVRKSAEILLSLINDILDFSKIEARKLDLETIEFDIEEVVQNIERLLSFSAQKKGIDLVYSVSPNLPTKTFKGDPNRIGQILANLISNAIKFTEKGQVKIAVSCDSDNHLSNSERQKSTMLRIEVSDTGIGMPETALARMFQPFSQADASTSRRFGGTGLGLSICKHLTEMMGGEIGVRSTEGVGSTFWFTLNLEIGTPSNTAAEPLKKHDTINTALQKVRVLLADDNTVNQLIARKMLEKHGLRVDVVSNGIEVLDAMSSAPYDLILMDCQMPELDGYEATLKIRAHANSAIASIPIVAMTANAMAGDREKCLKVGMNDYVTKPVKADELSSVIQKVMQNHRKIRPTNVA